MKKQLMGICNDLVATERAAVVYRPVWNVESGHLTGFILRPAVPDAGKSLEATAKTEMALLAAASETLGKCLTEGRKLVMIVPVSFLTVHQYPFRSRYLSLLRRLPRRVREMIALQLGNIPVYVPKQRLRAVQGDLAPLCRTLLFSSDLRGANLDCVARGGVHACAVNLDERACDDQDGQKLMSAFAARTGCIGCFAMADGVCTTAMLCAAVSAGFRYIAGPVVQQDQQGVFAVRPFDLASVYGA